MFLGRIFFNQEKLPRPDFKVRRRVFGKTTNAIYPIAVWIIGIGLALYPIYIFPLYHPQKYQELQAKTRQGINQENIQPGGMRVWSNPFEPKPEEDKQQNASYVEGKKDDN